MILVVDDEIFLRTLIVRGLRREGFRVVEVDNGLMAIDKARKQRPDLILMDVMMPIIDGLEATRLIRLDDDLKNVPIIIMTSKNSIDDVKRVFTCNIDDYIVKPFRQEQLIERISACLVSL